MCHTSGLSLKPPASWPQSHTPIVLRPPVTPLPGKSQSSLPCSSHSLLGGPQVMVPMPVAHSPVSLFMFPHLYHCCGPPLQAPDLQGHLEVPHINLPPTEPSISPLLPHDRPPFPLQTIPSAHRHQAGDLRVSSSDFSLTLDPYMQCIPKS